MGAEPAGPDVHRGGRAEHVADLPEQPLGAAGDPLADPAQDRLEARGRDGAADAAGLADRVERVETGATGGEHGNGVPGGSVARSDQCRLVPVWKKVDGRRRGTDKPRRQRQVRRPGSEAVGQVLQGPASRARSRSGSARHRPGATRPWVTSVVTDCRRRNLRCRRTVGERFVRRGDVIRFPDSLVRGPHPETSTDPIREWEIVGGLTRSASPVSVAQQPGLSDCVSGHLTHAPRPAPQVLALDYWTAEPEVAASRRWPSSLAEVSTSRSAWTSGRGRWSRHSVTIRESRWRAVRRESALGWCTAPAAAA